MLNTDLNNIDEILEMVMLLCFGISWPLSVYKSYKSRSAAGKSFIFLFAVWIGYVAGISSKIISGAISFAFYFYILNIIVVSADIILYFRNRALDRKRLCEA